MDLFVRSVSIPYEVGSIKTDSVWIACGALPSQSPMKSGRLKPSAKEFGTRTKVSIPYEVGSIKTFGDARHAACSASQSPMKSGRLKHPGKEECHAPHESQSPMKSGRLKRVAAKIASRVAGLNPL